MVGRNGAGSVEHVVGVFSFFLMVMQDIRRQQQGVLVNPFVALDVFRVGIRGAGLQGDVIVPTWRHDGGVVLLKSNQLGRDKGRTYAWYGLTWCGVVSLDARLREEV